MLLRSVVTVTVTHCCCAQPLETWPCSLCPSPVCALNIQVAAAGPLLCPGSLCAHTADAPQHPEHSECCFHPLLVSLFMLSISSCCGLPFPQLCCPKNKSGPAQLRHSQAAQDAGSLLLFIGFVPQFRAKIKFQLARVGFSLHTLTVLPFHLN